MKGKRGSLPGEFEYLRKWVPIAVLIGIVSGVGALVFYEALAGLTYVMLGLGAGFFPPGAAGEGGAGVVFSPHPFLIPLITTLGGLLSGILVFGLDG